MAWTTPITWTTGYVATASDLNTHIRDNEDYLKTEADTINLVEQFQPARAFDTIYQNTTGKIMCICVCAGNVNTRTRILTGSTSPPIASTSSVLHVGVTYYDSQTFFVATDFYYTASSNATLRLWTEWEVH